MNTMLFGLIIVVLIGLLILGVAVLLDVQIPGIGLTGGKERQSIRSMLSSQRNVQAARKTEKKRGVGDLFKAAAEAKVERTVDSRLTLRKKLKFARWKLPPVLYRGAMLAISLCTFTFCNMYFNYLIQAISLMVGPLFMGWALNTAVDRRFKNFDADYPAFLLSLVGLLKTGMNPMQAIEAAAHGLNDGSLVKSEVEMMIERLRFGVSEDKSIGSFGEDIHHPEIELFVQALLLSRRVGGNLSDTLDRLAKQVRKRQYFRMAANAAVGLQRGSIWFIISILVSLEVYLYFVFPQAVVGAWADPTGKQVWQVAISVILLGLHWVKQVTKIRT